jgi:hypothetical protein
MTSVLDEPQPANSRPHATKGKIRIGPLFILPGETSLSFPLIPPIFHEVLAYTGPQAGAQRASARIVFCYKGLRLAADIRPVKGGEERFARGALRT